MKRYLTYTLSTVAAAVMLASLVVSPALAWHPQGVITKQVQDVTANGSLVSATSNDAAVPVAPNDILNYVVIVSNNGAPASNGDDDMAKTVMTDTLPAGVELVSSPSQRTLTENMGTITPGKSVKMAYQVKVTSTENGAYLPNIVCFTGNSIVNDNAQQGCATSIVKVVVPPTPVPTPPSTPTPTRTPIVPAPAPMALPNTGAGNFMLPVALGIAVIGYVFRLYRDKQAA